MQKLNKIRSFSLALCAGVALAASAPASAQHGGHFGGWHGGYGGWHGGYGWRGGFWGPWGWGWGGLGLGLYFATLPYYYSTYWWGGVPYYYADNTYYRWNAGVGQYETVAPPAGIQNPRTAPGIAAGTRCLGSDCIPEEWSDRGAVGQGQIRVSPLGGGPNGLRSDPAGRRVGARQSSQLSAGSSRMPRRPRLQRQISNP